MDAERITHQAGPLPSPSRRPFHRLGYAAADLHGIARPNRAGERAATDRARPRDVHSLPWLNHRLSIAATAVDAALRKVQRYHWRRRHRADRAPRSISPARWSAAGAEHADAGARTGAARLGGGGMASTGMVVLGDIAATEGTAGAITPISRRPTPPRACGPGLAALLRNNLHWKVDLPDQPGRWIDRASRFTTKPAAATPATSRAPRIGSTCLGAGLIMAARSLSCCAQSRRCALCLGFPVIRCARGGCADDRCGLRAALMTAASR